MEAKILEGVWVSLDLETLDDGGGFVIINQMPRIPKEFIDDGKLDIFKEDYRVKDVYRYTITITNKTVNNLGDFLPVFDKDGRKFPDQFADEEVSSDSVGNILLILESPHRDEYELDDNKLTPIAPAQGSTGDTIRDHIITVIEIIINKSQSPNLNGIYNLIIANPVPYCCSLGVFQKPKDELMPKIRNDIWKKVWFSQSNGKYPIQEDFITRYQKYNPVITINCCTKKLRSYVTQLLRDKDKHCVFEANHPAINWRKNKYGIEFKF